jgi:stringent starvation protein A
MKRSIMTLYSDPSDIYCHRVRLVLAEKGVATEIINVDPLAPPQELLELSPYQKAPTLVDRELVVYEPGIIMEYLDERFPHPPLLPVYPIAKAKFRMMILSIEKEWMPLLEQIKSGEAETARNAQKTLSDHITSLAPIFEETPFFLGEDFSLVDSYLAPIFWRLPKLGVTINNKTMNKYAERVFARDGFKFSLSELEAELRD